MGQGEFQRLLDLHDIEATTILDFYELHVDEINDPNNIIYFHGGSNGAYQPVIWQGNSYLPVPTEAEGFEVKGDKTLPRPTIKIANLDYLFSQYAKLYNSFSGAKFVRKQVMVKYLDDENFNAFGNPYGTADSNMGFPDDIFYVNRISIETKTFLELELVSPLEFENISIPRRIVLADYCPFFYRGDHCGYSSKTKLYNSANTALSVGSQRGKWNETDSYIEGDIVHLFSKTKIGILENSDPNGHFAPSYTQVVFRAKLANINKNPFMFENNWERDECAKTISACKKRYGSSLRYGGFPGTHGYGV